MPRFITPTGHTTSPCAAPITMPRSIGLDRIAGREIKLKISEIDFVCVGNLLPYKEIFWCRCHRKIL